MQVKVLIVDQETLNDLTIGTINESMIVAGKITQTLELAMQLNAGKVRGTRSHVFNLDEIDTGGGDIAYELKALVLARLLQL